jgi:hypothetical protein
MENLACELAAGKDWVVGLGVAVGVGGVRTASDGSLTEESDFVLWVCYLKTSASTLEHVQRQMRM